LIGLFFRISTTRTREPRSAKNPGRGDDDRGSGRVGELVRGGVLATGVGLSGFSVHLIKPSVLRTRFELKSRVNFDFEIENADEKIAFQIREKISKIGAWEGFERFGSPRRDTEKNLEPPMHTDSHR
jgi:hypothetical protein